MGFADELRKKSNEYSSFETQSKNMEQQVSSIVKDCIYGLKEFCVSEAKKGKTGISGFLSVDYEEYATTPSAHVSDRNFEPFKTKEGNWYYSPGYSFDYGGTYSIHGATYDTSNEYRLKIATLIKDGILHGLSDCGFSHLSAKVVTKPNYKKFLSSFSGHDKFSKSTDELHFIYISISWK